LDLFAICLKKRRGGQLIAAKNSVLQGGTHSGRRREMSCRAVSEAVDWQVVDRALRGIAARRAALDSEEARWLREAEALQIWKQLGMVSALDYMERVLGYAPRSAQERLRVARALGALPKLDAALAQGRLAFTAVRELTRVATPANEAAWLEAATGKNLRQIEELVADHRLGDGPTDPKDPAARTHIVRFELSASTYARLRQTRQALESERTSSLSDDELVALLCEASLAGGDASEADDGRAKFQVAMTVCERCQQGWQEGAGVRLPVDSSTVERAMCDAQHIGSLDGEAPERSHQDVTPSVARFVRRRDGGRCRMPGCRSARGLEIHHIVHREHGGGHEAGNLILLCSSCHTAHHDGILTIRGTAAALEVERTPSKLDRAVSHARSAHVDAGQAEGVAGKLGRALGVARDAHLDAGRTEGVASKLDRAISHARSAHVDAGRAEGVASKLDRTIGHARSACVDAVRGEGTASKLDRAIGHARSADVDANGADAGHERSKLGRAIDGARGADVDANGANAGHERSKLGRTIGHARSAYVDANGADAGHERSKLGRVIDGVRGADVDANGADAGRERSKLGRAIDGARGADVDANGADAGHERSKLGRVIDGVRGADVDANGADAGRERSKLGRAIDHARGADVDANGADAGHERSKLGRAIDGARRAARGADHAMRAERGGAEADRGEMRRGDAHLTEMCGQAKRALVDAGWSRAVASNAVAGASAKLSGEAGGRSLERLLFEAFRACPRPRPS
jgi:hypothetical protein